MIRLVTFVATLLVSASAMANPALVGFWVDGCQSTGTPNQFIQSVTEFRADGQIIQTMSGYSDSACTNTVGSEVYAGTYTATAADVRILAAINGSNIDLTMSYILNGDMLTLTPKALTVDGNPQDVSRMGPSTMKRK